MKWDPRSGSDPCNSHGKFRFQRIFLLAFSFLISFNIFINFDDIHPMRYQKKNFTILFAWASTLLLPLLFLALLGCSPRTHPLEQAVEKQILFVGNGTEPESLDPHLATGLPEIHILNAL